MVVCASLRATPPCILNALALSFTTSIHSFSHPACVRACVRAEEEATNLRETRESSYLRPSDGDVGAVFIIVKPEDFRRICPYYLRAFMLASLPHHELTILLSYQ